MFKLIDLIIILCFLALSIFIIFKPYGDSGKKLLLIVEKDEFFIPYVDGKYSLNGKVRDIYGKEHAVFKHIQYTIEKGMVKVINSDCANKICINTPAVSKCGEAVICAPNKTAFIISCDNILKGSK